jgi:hypothetical protein
VVDGRDHARLVAALSRPGPPSAAVPAAGPPRPRLVVAEVEAKP